MRKKQAFLWHLAISLLLVLLFVSRAAGQELILRNMIVNNDQGVVHLRFGLRARDAEKLSRYLKQGTDLRLVCTAAMDLERNLWLDKELRRSAKQSLLRYDSLDDEYRISMGKNKTSERDSDLSSLLHKEWGRIDMYLGPWPEKYKEENLALHLRVRLIRTDVPVWLKRTLFFWSWNVVPVKNYRIRFGS
ncbi:MAG: DUF4390 domain-containing protein [Desulfohalobiaceae bacterium]|nr:DUF4390 domain-containing protein [Desulfohalobiaceae bacterium]